MIWRVRMLLAALLSAPAVLVSFPLRVLGKVPIVGWPFRWLLGFPQTWVKFCLVYVGGVPVPELRSLEIGMEPRRARRARLASRLSGRGRR